jgi:hypothetical protein
MAHSWRGNVWYHKMPLLEIDHMLVTTKSIPQHCQWTSGSTKWAPPSCGTSRSYMSSRFQGPTPPTTTLKPAARVTFFPPKWSSGWESHECQRGCQGRRTGIAGANTKAVRACSHLVFIMGSTKTGWDPNIPGKEGQNSSKYVKARINFGSFCNQPDPAIMLWENWTKRPIPSGESLQLCLGTIDLSNLHFTCEATNGGFLESNLYVCWTSLLHLCGIKKAICSNHIFKKKISDKNDFIYIHYVHVCAITIINQSTPQCMLTHSQRRNVVSSHRHRTGPCNFSANSSQVGAKTFQRKAHCSDSGRLPFGTRTFHHAYYMETSKETEQNTSFYCCIYVMIKEWKHQLGQISEAVSILKISYTLPYKCITGVAHCCILTPSTVHQFRRFVYTDTPNRSKSSIYPAHPCPLSTPSYMSRLFFSRLTFIHLIPRNWTGQTSQFPKFQVHLRFQDGDASFHRPSPKVHLGIWKKSALQNDAEMWVIHTDSYLAWLNKYSFIAHSYA